ncbi:MAG: hypothetical protein R3C12_11830 [Planctomycetaceae bacterium]
MVAPLYLDHAATSCPKPAAVGERLGRYFAEASLSAGQGSYRRAELLGREISAAVQPWRRCGRRNLPIAWFSREERKP